MTREPSPAAVRDKCQALMRSKWFMPLFCLALGAVVLVASWLGGHPGEGVFSLAVMAAFGLFLLLVAGRSETVRGLTSGGDERFAQIDLRATAVAGLAVIMALIVALADRGRPRAHRQPVQLAGGDRRPRLPQLEAVSQP